MASLPEVSAAVAQVIDDATLPHPVTVERSWLPIHDLAELADTVVSVMPAGQTTEPAGRSRRKRQFRVEVGVQRKLTTDEASEIDDLVALSDAVAALFERQRLPGLDTVVWAKAEHQPVVALEHLNEMRQFTGVILLTFTEWD